MNDLITLREAAKTLAIHPKTLWRWAKDGRITYVRVGTRLKFRPSVLATFISKREVAA